MRKNIFKLTDAQLQDIALEFREATIAGLAADNGDLLCIPTFITPRTDGIKGKALVLDLGGTNYRVAVVDFDGETPVIHPENGWKKDLTVMKSPGFTEADLLAEQADPIGQIRLGEEMPIGYCFSFPAESMENGDALLVHWNKGVDIKEMIGKPVGKTLLDYLSDRNIGNFTGVKVINDTVASLFAGAAKPGYDSYIGLIVGTGTNMAPFMPVDRIPKLDGKGFSGQLPVNLESGGFRSPHFTEYDDIVDQRSISKGAQRFEKAISGFYLGELLRAVFPEDDLGPGIDASTLTAMISYPAMYKEDYVEVARGIYRRSAELVGASIAGLVLLLREQNPAMERVLLTAEGGLYWSEVRGGKNYHDIVTETLRRMLGAFGLSDVTVDINKMDNANLIGTGVAALS